MLSAEEFKQLIHLARLDPEDQALFGLREDFNKILEYVQQVQEADTSSVEDFVGATETQNVMRDDQAEAVLDVRSIAGLAPEWESGHFVVPGIIESEG